MPRRDGFQFGPGNRAGGHGARATRVEMAAARWSQRRRDLALDRDELPLAHFEPWLGKLKETLGELIERYPAYAPKSP